MRVIDAEAVAALGWAAAIDAIRAAAVSGWSPYSAASAATQPGTPPSRRRLPLIAAATSARVGRSEG